MQALRDLVTTSDGVTHDLGRWSWIASFAAVIGLTGWHCWKGTAPTVIELATALGAVAGAHAGALFFKRQTEPKDPS